MLSEADRSLAFSAIVALFLLLLTVSGFYMWLKPLLIRRDNARTRVRVAAQVPVNVAPASRPELVEA